MRILGREVEDATPIQQVKADELMNDMSNLSSMIKLGFENDESFKCWEFWELVGSECAAFAERVRYLKSCDSSADK